MSEEQQGNNNNTQQQKPDFNEFEKLQQQNMQPASQTQPVQYDQQGNAIFPQQDNLGNPNRSRGIIGAGNQQQQQQQANSSYDRPKWDKTNPPTIFPEGQQQPQVQKIQNPTSPQELEQLIKQQEQQTARNHEAAQERDKALKLKIQGQLHSYVPPEHLKDHPYLAEYINQTPAEQQGQQQTTQQKLDSGEEVISITDQQPQDQGQPIQPSQIKNGIENLITEQQAQEEQQQGTATSSS